MMIQYEADIARWVTAPPAVCDATGNVGRLAHSKADQLSS